ncbi:MAG: ion channel [Victivallaceae bacterium]|nr:ion channel [Victivallaceae bacterium]
MRKAKQWVNGSKCAVLTGVVTFFLVFSTLTTPDGIIDRLLSLCFFVAMLFAPYFVSKNRRVGMITLAVGALFFIPHAITVFGDEEFLLKVRTPADAFTVVLIFFELMLTALVMRYSLSATKPEEPVFGCVLTYLLIGIVFANIYMLIAQHNPGAFLENGEPMTATTTNMRYFSFVTLTTCGFGDIVAKSPFSRIVCGAEATVGVLYVGVFIGRMASLAVKRPPAK